MSRIGRKEILIPAGVSATVIGDKVTVTGPKATLTQNVDSKLIVVKVENGHIVLTRTNEENETKAKHGLYRSLIANMVEGVHKDFSKTLIINGVGYKAQKVGKKLVLNLGLSHQIEVEEEDGIKVECPSITEIKISGPDKEKVGRFSAKIRTFRPVEPYHAYGIKYSDEVVIKKVGKTAAKGKK
ncbi:MAG: 50S ribosomal protein L6 [Clostridia bacterium]